MTIGSEVTSGNGVAGSSETIGSAVLTGIMSTPIMFCMAMVGSGV